MRDSDGGSSGSDGDSRSDVPSNGEIAQQLDRVGDLLELEEANPFRVRAYRRAADELRARERVAAAAGGDGAGDDTVRHRRPPVDLLLEVDEEYRRKAEAGELRRIAPRRFNPEGEAWLPVMEVQRGRWEMRVLFSNTRRAHELDRTRDWVVIYWDADGDHGQSTVVTDRSGELEGRRVVRGREPECREH